MEAFLGIALGDFADEVDFIAIGHPQEDDAAAELVEDRISQVAQVIHRISLSDGCDDRNAADIFFSCQDAVHIGQGCVFLELSQFFFRILELGQESFQFGRRIADLAFQEACQLLQFLRFILSQLEGSRTGNGFDTADAGASNAERTDDRRVGHMRAAAEFAAEVVDGDDADDIAVFFTEQGHSALFFGRIEGHFFDGDGDGLEDFFVDQGFDLIQFILRDRREMGEVETQVVRCDQ